MLVHLIYGTSLLTLFTLFIILVANVKKSPAIRSFTALITLALLYAGFNYGASVVNSADTSETLFKLSILFGALTPIFFIKVADEYPKKLTNLRLFRTWFIPIGGIIALINVSPWSITQIENTDDIHYAITGYGPGYVLYFVYLLVFFSLGLYGIYRKRDKLNVLHRKQLNYMLAGILVVLVGNIMISFSLDLFFEGGSSNLFALVMSIVPVTIAAVLTTYTVLKVNMFDIRGIVLRSLGYFGVLTIIMLAIIAVNIVIGVIEIGDSTTLKLENYRLLNKYLVIAVIAVAGGIVGVGIMKIFRGDNLQVFARKITKYAMLVAVVALMGSILLGLLIINAEDLAGMDYLTFPGLITVVVFTLFGIGLTVFLRSTRNFSHISFSLLTIVLAGLAVVNYLSVVFYDTDHELTLASIRLVMAFATLLNATFLLFATNFANDKFKVTNIKFFLMYLLLTLCTVAAALSPYLFTNLTVEEGKKFTEAGPGIILFSFYIVFSVSISFRALYMRYRQSTNLVLKKQLKYIFVASTLLMIVVPITNFLLTNIYRTVFFSRIAPLYILAYTALVGYVILRHKFLNIGILALRATSYLIAILALGLSITALLGFLLSSIDAQLGGNQIGLVALLIAVLSGFSFWPLKKLFDKLTRKIFYRDAYETRTVLDQLADVLIVQRDLDSLLEQSLKVYESAIKPSNSYLLTFNKDGPYKKQSIGKYTWFDDDLIEQLSKKRKTINVESSDSGKLIEALNKYEISIVQPLYLQNKIIAIILLGPKQTGTTYTNQDIELLSISGKNLAIAIDNALKLEEISDFNITLKKEVEEATADLRRTNRKLKELDLAKDEFVSMASHQLRTPLTTITNYLAILKDGKLGPNNEEQLLAIQKSHQSTGRMVLMINELLDASRISSGRFTVNIDKVDLRSLLKKEVEQQESGAEAKQLEVVIKALDSLPIVYGDKAKLGEVLANFLDNAIMYTPEGGRIIVQAEVTNKEAIVTVVDNGVGIPKHEQKKLFKKFYRSKDARELRPDGTGLGLYVAKKVMTAHNGKVILESTPGEGSTFGFKLPIITKGIDSSK